MRNEAAAEFETLKKTIEELKLKQMSDLREKERLTAEFEKLKQQIKETYGVEIEDFEKAIEALEKDAASKLAELKSLVSECQEKFGML